MPMGPMTMALGATQMNDPAANELTDRHEHSFQKPFAARAGWGATPPK